MTDGPKPQPSVIIDPPSESCKNNLLEAIQEIRKEFHKIAEKNRREMEHLYQIRLSQIQQQNDQEKRMISDKLQNLQAENDRLRRLIEEDQNEVSKINIHFLILDQSILLMGSEK